MNRGILFLPDSLVGLPHARGDEPSDRNIQLGRPPFSEAISVFKDKHKIKLDVSRVADGEARTAYFGKSQSGKLLYVVFCLRGKRIRIISVRENRKLRSYYERQK